jgi:hypothetical protein
MLLSDTFGQMGQIFHGAFDLALRPFKIAGTHQWHGSRQAPAGAVGDGEHHRQIAQEFFGNRRWLRFQLLLCF